MRDRDAAITHSERLRRGLVAGSVAGSVGIAGALAVAAITSQPTSASTASGGTSTPPAHHAARPHLTPGQRLLRQLQNLANGSSGTGQSQPHRGATGGGLAGGGSGHATTSGS